MLRWRFSLCDGKIGGALRQATLYQRPSAAFLRLLEEELTERGETSSVLMTSRDITLILWSLCVLDVENVPNGRGVLLQLVKQSHQLLLRDGLDGHEDDEVIAKHRPAASLMKKSKVQDDVRVVKYRQVGEILRPAVLRFPH